MPTRLRLLLHLLIALLALAACEGTPVPVPPSVPSTVAPEPDPAPIAPEIQAEPTLPEVPEAPAVAVPSPDAEPQERVAASHILVSYVGASGRPMNVHRSESAARRKAEDLLERLQAGEDFATLARQESDDATRVRGGFLGGFNRGTMAPSFEQAAFALPVGGLSEVVQTPFGFHILRREPLAEVRVAQILVQWQSAPSAATNRSKDEAQARIQEAWERLQAGVPFAEVARDYSDGAAGLRGGDLGWFTRGQFLPAWEEKAFALAPGETCPPFESGVGYHILERLE